MNQTSAQPRDGGQVETIRRAEFARRMGISKAAVSQSADKRLNADAWADPDTKRWLLWPEAARQWQDSADPQAALKEQPQAQAPAGTDTPLEAAASAPAGRGEVESLPGYKSHKEREAKVKADLAEIELHRQLDRYRDKDEIARALVTCGRAIRQQLDQIELWAGELAELTGGDTAEIRRLLRTKVRDLQARAADTLQRYSAEDDADADAGDAGAASDEDGETEGDHGQAAVNA